MAEYNANLTIRLKPWQSPAFLKELDDVPELPAIDFEADQENSITGFSLWSNWFCCFSKVDTEWFLTRWRAFKLLGPLLDIKGVVDKIQVAVAKFHGHFRTQWGRLPQKTSKTYPFT